MNFPLLTKRKINIAIDGYSSCGKGTLAKFLANTLGYAFVDSGAMYRAITLAAQRNAISADNEAGMAILLEQTEIHFEWNEASGKFEIVLNGENVESEIRSLHVASEVSNYAALPAVRRKLVAMQKQLALNKGVVMDGRDIGTVVIPDAELKIFMKASPEVRAQRRFEELKKNNPTISYNEVFENLINRDKIDSSRKDSPLTLTSDYKVLDNSDLTIDQQNSLVLQWVQEVITQ